MGSANTRKLGAIYVNSSSSGLDIIHGVLDLVFLKLFKKQKNYELKEASVSYYLHSLQCEILLDGKVVGDMGVLHPKVLKNYNIPFAASYLELDLDQLFSKSTN